MSGSYTIYGGELSLFTRKLEAALTFYGADFSMRDKNTNEPQLIETRSGTHQVPVLLTPENWMLADTTPILRLLDGRYPERALFPEGPMGFLVHLLEDFFDEWVARVMVHYRWHYPRSAEFAAMRMAGGDQAIAERVMAWGPRACRATGTDSEHQRREVEAEYERILDAAEAQLQSTAFLLGDRPTALDCIVLGGLRAHTNMDPDPKEVTARFPTVVAWAESRADEWQGGGALAPFEHPTDFARHILGEMPQTYLPFLLANAQAQAAGSKACRANTYGEEVSYLCRPYPEISRQMLVDRMHALPEGERTQVREWLSSQDLTALVT